MPWKDNPKANERENALKNITWALGTLKSATNNISIAENFPEAKKVVDQDCEIAKTQIERIRRALTQLEETLP